MKKHFLRGLGAAVLAGVLAVLSVPSQAAELRCTVPFSFQVREATLPPGTYTVSIAQATVTIQSRTRGAFALGNPRENAGKVSPRLVFHRYGNEYILREVWTSTSGRELLQSPREKKLGESRRGAMAAFERVVIPLS